MKKILWIICLLLSFQSVQAKEENNYILKLYKSYSSYKTYFPEKEIDNVSKWSSEKKKCLTYQRKAIGSRSFYETVNECSYKMHRFINYKDKTKIKEVRILKTKE